MKIKLSQRNDVEIELRDAVIEMEKLPREYKVKLLMEIYDKALALAIEPVSITYRDVQEIKSSAIRNIVEMPGKIAIGGKDLPNNDNKHVAMINATIGALNRLEALRKLPVIDITDPNIDSGDEW